MKKHWFVFGFIATLALVASPFMASANSQQSGIWIVNETPNCLWATVYSSRQNRRPSRLVRGEQ